MLKPAFRWFLFALFALAGVLVSAAAAQDVKPGDDVVIVLRSNQQLYMKLMEITDTAYKVEASGLPTTIDKKDVLSIHRRGEIVTPTPAGVTVTTPTPEIVVPTGSLPQISGPDQALLGGIKSETDNLQFQRAIDLSAEFLQKAPGNAPNLAPYLDTAIRKRLEELELESVRCQSDEQCGQLERKLDTLVTQLRGFASKGMTSAPFNGRFYLGRIAQVWSLSYRQRLSMLQDNRQKPAQEKQQKLQEMQAYLTGQRSLVRSENLPDNAQVLYTEAAILAYLGRTAQAAESLNRARQVPGSDSKLMAEMNGLDQKLKSNTVITIQNENSGPATPTPTPRPTPEPKGAKKAAAVASGLYKDYLQPVAEWAMNNIVLVLGGAALILLFWALPGFLISRQVGQGDVRASIYKKQVSWLGALGYMIYLIRRPSHSGGKGGAVARPQMTRSARKSKVEGHICCPSCNRPIDTMDSDATSLRFDMCPNCGKEIEPVFNLQDYVSGLVHELTQVAEERSKKKRKRGAPDLVDSQTMTNLLASLYTMSVRRRASDIHIERNPVGALVQFRVDGMLADAMKISSAVAPSFLSAIKVQANLDITNHMTPQDGRFHLSVEEIDFDVRINCSPSTQGEILFMRLLDQRNIQMSPEKLGFVNVYLQNFNEAIHKPHGLILVTGPTGSGKSTTLYVALNLINTGERNIVTIEDPVEYQIPGLKQMQVNPHKGFTFATGLRSIVRQDPDVIMVGEVRDEETANMAIDAAVTGHLVYTTLHTMDTATAISRLADLGVSAKRYASALEVIIAQRLVRLICNDCKQPHNPTDPEVERLGILKVRNSIKFQAGVGCNSCNYTGYYGREALLEMLKPDEEMRNLMERETRPHVLREFARRKGMRLLREEGIMKIMGGRTTVEEIIRVTC